MQPTILIVDDEPAVRALAKQLFGQRGYRVLVAESAIEALKILAEESGRIELVITDYSMPGADGAQLSITIQDTYPKLFVIIISGLGQTLQLQDPGVDMIPKPIDFNLLMQKVKKLLGPG